MKAYREFAWDSPRTQLMSGMPVPGYRAKGGARGVYREGEKQAGILLPHDNHPGTGNIVIIGAPGSAKPDAWRGYCRGLCAAVGKPRHIGLLPLGDSSGGTRTKAAPFQWDNIYRKVRALDVAGRSRRP